MGACVAVRVLQLLIERPGRGNIPSAPCHTQNKKNKKRQRFRVTNLASWLLCALLSGGLNLGKKISVPKDVMMEELNLSSNRGSRMFLERQKRAERFTMENVANDVNNTSSVRIELRESPKPSRKVPLSHQGSF